MSFNELISNLKDLNIELTTYQQEQLITYKDFLIEYNKHTNLTAITNEEDIYLKHFYDSLTITKIIDLSNQKILDIGTGAGFPGMVLKIVYPELDITLLDSNNKKITFLKELSSKLNIKVNLINDRAEEYIKDNRESFDIVVSRAVANLNTLSELSLPFVKVNGYFIAMKANATEEINNSLNALKTLNSNIEEQLEFKLINNDLRTLIKIKKNKPNDNKYPRRYDKIIKQPL